MKRHIHIVGARPNFMKAAPVLKALRDDHSAPVLVHTGQHYDKEMSEIFFNQLQLPEPDINLGIGSGSQARQTAALLIAIAKTMEELTPERVVVYGDINSTAAAALAAAKLGIPLAHVEAGLRSFDRTMPEEINRVVTDAIADLHFVTSPEAIGHLAREGARDDGMHFVGNPMIDTLLWMLPFVDQDTIRERFDLPTRYAVATIHRPANVDSDSGAQRIVEGLEQVSSILPIVFPVHPRGRQALVKAGLMEIPTLVVTDPLGYQDFIALVSKASLVLTDSGGIQEETTILGVPCLTLRPNTERPITISMGTNRLVGTDPEAIATGAADLLNRGASPAQPPLWDGHAGQRIADILATH